MSENIREYLLSSIPPGCVSTRTNKGLESMYLTYLPNDLTDGPILHVKADAVVNLGVLKENVVERKLEIKYSENEWIIYKPNPSPVK